MRYKENKGKESASERVARLENWSMPSKGQFERTPLRHVWALSAKCYSYKARYGTYMVWNVCWTDDATKPENVFLGKLYKNNTNNTKKQKKKSFQCSWNLSVYIKDNSSLSEYEFRLLSSITMVDRSLRNIKQSKATLRNEWWYCIQIEYKL